MGKYSNQSFWVLLIFLLGGVVLGGFLGEYLSSFSYLSFLNYGKTFGLTKPILLDLGILCIEFGITLKFTIAGIIGIILSFVLYKKYVK